MEEEGQYRSKEKNENNGTLELGKQEREGI
jgi:hypothetical protein